MMQASFGWTSTVRACATLHGRSVIARVSKAPRNASARIRSQPVAYLNHETPQFLRCDNMPFQNLFVLLGSLVLRISPVIACARVYVWVHV